MIYSFYDYSLNFQYVSGLYPVKLPFVLGRDGAGIVSQLGEGVSEFKIGDRVAYASGSGFE